VLLWRICEANPFTHAVELIRFALYGQFALTPFLVTLGCALAFLGIAILGYDPARGFIQARRPG
jgi:ABC-2 type transport system permease protein